MKTIQVDDRDNQKTVQVAAGDRIAVQLDETPTTGYQWEIGQINADQIELVDKTYALYPEAGIGGGGVRTFQLQVLKEGAGRIVLENRQSWSNDVYKTFTLFYKPG